jgi:hypothetical protein
MGSFAKGEEKTIVAILFLVLGKMICQIDQFAKDDGVDQRETDIDRREQ